LADKIGRLKTVSLLAKLHVTLLDDKNQPMKARDFIVNLTLALLDITGICNMCVARNQSDESRLHCVVMTWDTQ